MKDLLVHLLPPLLSLPLAASNTSIVDCEGRLAPLLVLSSRSRTSNGLIIYFFIFDDIVISSNASRQFIALRLLATPITAAQLSLDPRASRCLLLRSVWQRYHHQPPPLDVARLFSERRCERDEAL